MSDEMKLSEFIHKMYEFYPDLVEFDKETGERALFKESLESLRRVIISDLRDEPLVIGFFLMKILGNPQVAGAAIIEAWSIGGPFPWERMAKKHKWGKSILESSGVMKFEKSGGW